LQPWRTPHNPWLPLPSSTQILPYTLIERLEKLLLPWAHIQLPLAKATIVLNAYTYSVLQYWLPAIPPQKPDLDHLDQLTKWFLFHLSLGLFSHQRNYRAEISQPLLWASSLLPMPRSQASRAVWIPRLSVVAHRAQIRAQHLIQHFSMDQLLTQTFPKRPSRNFPRLYIRSLDISTPLMSNPNNLQPTHSEDHPKGHHSSPSLSLMANSARLVQVFRFAILCHSSYNTQTQILCHEALQLCTPHMCTFWTYQRSYLSLLQSIPRDRSPHST